ncbi:MAG: hypothetical protein ACE5JS_22340 [Nitrospinota bacterium]
MNYHEEGRTGTIKVVGPNLESFVPDCITPVCRVDKWGGLWSGEFFVDGEGIFRCHRCCREIRSSENHWGTRWRRFVCWVCGRLR